MTFVALFRCLLIQSGPDRDCKWLAKVCQKVEMVLWLPLLWKPVSAVWGVEATEAEGCIFEWWDRHLYNTQNYPPPPIHAASLHAHFPTTAHRPEARLHPPPPPKKKHPQVFKTGSTNWQTYSTFDGSPPHFLQKPLIGMFS